MNTGGRPATARAVRFTSPIRPPHDRRQWDRPDLDPTPASRHPAEFWMIEPEIAFATSRTMRAWQFAPADYGAERERFHCSSRSTRDGCRPSWGVRRRPFREAGAAAQVSRLEKRTVVARAR